MAWRRRSPEWLPWLFVALSAYAIVATLAAVVDDRSDTPVIAFAPQAVVYPLMAALMFRDRSRRRRGIPPSPAEVALETGNQALSLGARLCWRHRRTVAGVLALSGLQLAVPLAVLAAVNRVVFGEVFVVDLTPSGAAEIAAGLTLVVTCVVELVVATAAFGAFCAVGLRPGCTSREAVRRSWRRLAGCGGRAVAGMLATVVGTVLIVPGALLAATFTPVALDEVAGRARPGDGPRQRAARGFGVTNPLALFAITFWALGIGIARKYEPPATTVAILIAVVLAVAAVVAAWIAASFVQLRALTALEAHASSGKDL